MDNQKMDDFMVKVGVLGRRLMELQKSLSDVAWGYDSLVIEYAQFRQKEEKEKQAKEKQAKQSTEKKVEKP